MPLEVAVLAGKAAGLDGLRQVAALMDPPMTVRPEFEGACVSVVDGDQQVVAVVQRPCGIAYGGDIARCVDQPTELPDDAKAWTEGFVPFHDVHRGLVFWAALAVASDGRLFVKGAGREQLVG